MTMEHYSDAQLALFRSVQRLAYDIAAKVAADLEPGVTELDAMHRLVAASKAAGVTDMFHQPFAWFGDRAAFKGFHHLTSFFPTERQLEPGMPYILDLALIKDGHATDIGYTVANGSATCEQLRRDLVELRTLILEHVRAGDTMRQVYEQVDEALKRQGNENCHKVYPSHVLGHKVGDVAHAGVATLKIAGFEAGALAYLAKQELSPFLGHPGGSALWNAGHGSKEKPDPGLWAIEPHIGRDGVGAKWEEILVVTDTDAYWLDDAVPHLRV